MTWVRFVLSAISIYVLMRSTCLSGFIKAIDKLRREQVDSCLVAWEKVKRPLDLFFLKLDHWDLEV
jgi:hypothetical protein